jgi:hypothetical protein
MDEKTAAISNRLNIVVLPARDITDVGIVVLASNAATGESRQPDLVERPRCERRGFAEGVHAVNVTAGFVVGGYVAQVL